MTAKELLVEVTDEVAFDGDLVLETDPEGMRFRADPPKTRKAIEDRYGAIWVEEWEPGLWSRTVTPEECRAQVEDATLLAGINKLPERDQLAALFGHERHALAAMMVELFEKPRPAPKAQKQPKKKRGRPRKKK